MDAPPIDFASNIESWANFILMWIGFGTLVGLLAKAIMPGRDPGGAVATLCMGIGGAVFGCGILKFFWESQKITPLSPTGLVVSTAGAFLILFFYRLLGGYFFHEGEGRRVVLQQPHARRRRASNAVVHYDE